MAQLSQEIEKLAIAAHPGAVSREHVIAMLPAGPDQRVFRFLDAATEGELRSAFIELDRLLDAGEEPAMLLAQLLGQIELMAVASAGANRDSRTIARELGSISASRMSAIASSAQRRGLPSDSSLDVGATIDRQLKTGHLRRPEDALGQLLLALAAPGSEHRTARWS